MSSLLDPVEIDAVWRSVRRVAREVPARLVQASLFGSRARGEGRPDSDIDVLLVFRRLPFDREPHASMAEDIAESIADGSGVPVNVWSVSLADLAVGNRTPMLVDALADSVPVWVASEPLPAVQFTPDDARRCCGALLARVSEGSHAVADARRRARSDEAAARVRDDVVRLCTAWLLLHGVTRPRRGEAVRRFAERARPPSAPSELHEILEWAALSFGPGGRDESRPVPLPPGGLVRAGRVIDGLAAFVVDTARHPRRPPVPLPTRGGIPSSRSGAPLLRHPVYQNRRV